MRELAAVLDELVADAPVTALRWTDVLSRSAERKPRRHRRSILVLLAAAAMLAVVGTAVGVGISLLDQQRLFHDGASDHPGRLGPMVEVATGESWALIAWQSDFGVCLDFAIPGSSPFACDFPVRGAKPPTSTSGSGPPIHSVAGQISGGGLVGGDGKTTIFGVAAGDVAAVRIELRDGRTIDASVYDAPAALEAEVRLFIARVAIAPNRSDPGGGRRGYGPGGAVLEGDSPVLAFVAYDRRGDVIERVGG